MSIILFCFKFSVFIKIIKVGDNEKSRQVYSPPLYSSAKRRPERRNADKDV